MHFLFKSPKPNNSKGYGVRYACFAPTSTPDPAKSDATRYGSWVISRQPKSRPERSGGLLGRQHLALHTPIASDLYANHAPSNTKRANLESLVFRGVMSRRKLLMGNQVFHNGTPDIECNEHSQRNGKKDLPSVLYGPDEMTKCLECNVRALGRTRAAMTRTAKQCAWKALKRKISDAS